MVIDNATFAVDRSNTITLAGAIIGGGQFRQIGTGTTILTAANDVTGGTTISTGTLELGSGGSIAGNVTFTGAAATLRFDTGTNELGGDVLGMMIGDSFDLRFQVFAAGDQVIWQQTSANGGTLSLVSSSGTTFMILNLAGQYTSADFSAASDSQNGTLISLNNLSPAGNPPPPAGTTADMIMSDPSNGDYEIYDIGGNAILAAYSLGQVQLLRLRRPRRLQRHRYQRHAAAQRLNWRVHALRREQRQYHRQRHGGTSRPGMDGLGLWRFLQLVPTRPTC